MNPRKIMLGLASTVVFFLTGRFSGIRFDKGMWRPVGVGR